MFIQSIAKSQGQEILETHTRTKPRYPGGWASTFIYAICRSGNLNYRGYIFSSLGKTLFAGRASTVPASTIFQHVCAAVLAIKPWGTHCLRRGVTRTEACPERPVTIHKKMEVVQKNKIIINRSIDRSASASASRPRPLVQTAPRPAGWLPRFRRMPATLPALPTLPTDSFSEASAQARAPRPVLPRNAPKGRAGEGGPGAGAEGERLPRRGESWPKVCFLVMCFL